MKKAILAISLLFMFSGNARCEDVLFYGKKLDCNGVKFNANFLGMSVTEYQGFMHAVKKLGITERVINRNMLNLAMGAHKAGKGFNPQFDYALNILGVKIHRLNSSDDDIRGTIRTGLLLSEVSEKLSAINVPEMSKIELIMTLGMEPIMYKYTSVPSRRISELSAGFKNKCSASK